MLGISNNHFYYNKTLESSVFLEKSGERIFISFSIKNWAGNINNIQLAPTVQATSSNYQRAHKGGKTKLLEFFDERSENIVFDVKQNEQGYRYVEKYNRNMMVELHEEIDFDDHFHLDKQKNSGEFTYN